MDKRRPRKNKKFSNNGHASSRNSPQIWNSEVKENLFSSVNQYKYSKNSFSAIYNKWLPIRRSTLENLRSLYEEVRNGRFEYNEAQANMKDCSSEFRKVKIETDNEFIGFFASAMSFIADTASGFSSFSQAYNTDRFRVKFQEIMDQDAEITKELYEIRSQCISKYHGIEEVMKQFHSDTFSSTMNKISSSLQVDKHWEAVKDAYVKDDMPQLMSAIVDFFDNASQVEVLKEVGDSIDTYAHDNPATLECCKSTSKAVYGAVNMTSPISERNSVRGAIDFAANNYLMIDDRMEASRLRNTSSESCSQSKLETHIEDAIDLLESELKEISESYYNLLKSERN